MINKYLDGYSIVNPINNNQVIDFISDMVFL